jgi:hypothetical protein
MDAQHLAALEPELATFLSRFDKCFARSETRAHVPVDCQPAVVGSRISKERAWDRWLSRPIWCHAPGRNSSAT